MIKSGLNDNSKIKEEDILPPILNLRSKFYRNDDFIVRKKTFESNKNKIISKYPSWVENKDLPKVDDIQYDNLLDSYFIHSHFIVFVNCSLSKEFTCEVNEYVVPKIIDGSVDGEMPKCSSKCEKYRLRCAGYNCCKDGNGKND